LSQNPTVQVPVSLLDGVIGYVDLSSRTAKAALDEVGRHRKSAKEAADRVPGLLKHMVETGTCQKGQEKDATDLLSTHAGALVLLKTAVDKINELKGRLTDPAAGDLGAAVGSGEKRAEDSLTGVVGARSSLRKASDVPLLRLAGLAS
jgi:hypothetical protein